MPKLVEPKSPAAVNKLRDRPGLHTVGGVKGLVLQVTKNPNTGVLRRSWILRTMVGAKRRDIGLGSFPDVTLERAREMGVTGIHVSLTHTRDTAGAVVILSRD